MRPDDWFEALGGVVHIEGNLYRCPLPNTGEARRALKAADIDVVYSLEAATAGDYLRQAGFDWRPFPWTDFAPPSPQQVDAFVDDYLALPNDRNAVVHCRAGWGRAGTAITCALVARHGWSADQALTHFWSKVPRAEHHMRETGQADFVHGYAARRAGRGL